MRCLKVSVQASLTPDTRLAHFQAARCRMWYEVTALNPPRYIKKRNNQPDVLWKKPARRGRVAGVGSPSVPNRPERVMTRC